MEITKEEFVEAAKNCYTREELGNVFGVSVTTVRSYLKKFGFSAKDILKPREKKSILNKAEKVFMEVLGKIRKKI